MKKKRIKIIVGIIGFVLLLAGAAFAVWQLALNPYRETVSYYAITDSLDKELTKEQAREDLGYLFTKLKQYHPAYVDESKNLTDAVEKQYEEEVSKIEEKMTVLQLWQAAARIAAKMKDGHTGVYLKSEDIYCLSGRNDLSDKELITIDGVAVTDLYRIFCNQFSYELESYASYEFNKLIVREDYLRFIGIDTSDGVDITYLDTTGEKTVHDTFESLADVTPSQTGNEDAFVSYQLEETNHAAIFTLDECNYNEEYLMALNKFFTEVFDNNVENIIVDLRDNGGGNSMVVNAFLEYLNLDSYSDFSVDVRFGSFLWKNKSKPAKNEKKEKTYEGDLYVLTSSQTFSSANMFATIVSDNGIGTVVGEIPGNMPSGYGDVLSFRMPNSKLCLYISGKVWHRPDHSLDSEPLTPDVEVKAEDALTTVYGLIQK